MSLWAMVLLRILTFKASRIEIPPPESPATLLTTILFSISPTASPDLINSFIPEVSDIITFNGFKKEDVLACAAGLEVFSEHPIAGSLIKKAKELGIDTHKFNDFESVAGKGIKGECTVCDNSTHSLGNLKFIMEQKWAL